jgi:hypothetical protein
MDPEAARGNAFVSARNNRRISPRRKRSASIAEWHTRLASDWTQTLPDRPNRLKLPATSSEHRGGPVRPAQSAVARLRTDCGPDEGFVALRTHVALPTHCVSAPAENHPNVRATSGDLAARHTEGAADLGQTCPGRLERCLSTGQDGVVAGGRPARWLPRRPRGDRRQSIGYPGGFSRKTG